MPPSAQPTFRWTGFMILLPVLALGAVGLWQLRQDRAAALAEAQTDADLLLKEVLEIAKTIPQTDQKTATFSLTGKQVWPKPIPSIPRPTPQINPQAVRLTEIIDDPKLTSSEQAHALRELASLKNPGTTTAGFPVKHLALRNALRFGKEAQIESTTLQNWAADLIDSVSENPNLLSEKLHREAKAFSPSQNDAWYRAQASRKLLQKHASKIESLLAQNTSLSTWLDSETFCQIRRNPENISLTILTSEQLRQRAELLLKTITLPRHLGIRLSLDSHLILGDSKAGILSSATDSSTKAEIIFTDRAAFFQPVTQRSRRTAWLIAEDESAMRNVLSDLLVSQGHRIILAIDGEEALAKTASEKPDLILLDVMMPKLDGFSACAQLRKTGHRVPILMLTARGQIGDRVAGLDAGADDYLAKPFSRAELLARVRALLRRGEVREKTPDTLTLGNSKIDFIQMKARRKKRDLHLSPKEFAMLRMLAEAGGGVVTREEFLDAVWGYGSFPTTRTVDNHIAKLRAKIEPDPAEPQFIMTIFGAGYRLVS